MKVHSAQKTGEFGSRLNEYMAGDLARDLRCGAKLHELFQTMAPESPDLSLLIDSLSSTWPILSNYDHSAKSKRVYVADDVRCLIGEHTSEVVEDFHYFLAVFYENLAALWVIQYLVDSLSLRVDRDIEEFVHGDRFKISCSWSEGSWQMQPGSAKRQTKHFWVFEGAWPKNAQDKEYGAAARQVGTEWLNSRLAAEEVTFNLDVANPRQLTAKTESLVGAAYASYALELVHGTKTSKEAICPGCNVHFVPHDDRQEYHDQACYQRHYQRQRRAIQRELREGKHPEALASQYTINLAQIEAWQEYLEASKQKTK